MSTAQLSAQWPILKKTPGRPKFSYPYRGDRVRSTGNGALNSHRAYRGSFLWPLWLLLLSSMKKGLL
nr:hypothetical protein HUO10_001278 [Paraburkholderia busanensis]